MSVSVVSSYPISAPIGSQVHGLFDIDKSMSRWRQRCCVIRCSNNRRAGGRARADKNYYELLGVSVDSDPKEIKDSYRKLQKKYHPDIAGEKGHEYSLMLNEAYRVLMKEDLRREYDSSIRQMRVRDGTSYTGLTYSSWKGPMRPQALFVDETACVGCRECVHQASNTFEMDEALGCARVKVQYGDDDQKIEVSVESCPVNCIHWVEREQLAVLEFLIQPQPKDGYGVFGGGWERPANVFMAAKSFTKQLKQQTGNQRKAWATTEEETPAQAKARAKASIKIEMERYSRFWTWVEEIFGSNMSNRE